MPENTIVYKWKEGYKNLNLHFREFDHILLIDNSSTNNPVQTICSLSKNENNNYEVNLFNKIPNYAKRRFPEIYNILRNQ